MENKTLSSKISLYIIAAYSFLATISIIYLIASGNSGSSESIKKYLEEVRMYTEQAKNSANRSESAARDAESASDSSKAAAEKAGNFADLSQAHTAKSEAILIKITRLHYLPPKN